MTKQANDGNGRTDPVRMVVGGQVPPPVCGQHVSVAQTLERLRDDDRVVVEHLPYRFAEDLEGQGRVSIGKAVALARVLLSLVARRLGGPIDVFLHPVSGPRTAGAVKDAVITSVASLLCRRVVLQFHGGGHATQWGQPLTGLHRLLAAALGRADMAIVHARMHTADAALLRIDEVAVVPHRIPDRWDPTLRATARSGAAVRVLYVGHLGPQRGTPELVQAVHALRGSGAEVVLHLVGRPANGWTDADLRALLRHAPDDMVVHDPVLTGRNLDRAYAAADVFAFPSRHWAESFGLVLIEALMWGLPVVASDWRAAPEVLAGDDLAVVLHSVGDEMHVEIEAALRTAHRMIASGSWRVPSDSNRLAFQARYRDDVFPLGDVLVGAADVGAR